MSCLDNGVLGCFMTAHSSLDHMISLTRTSTRLLEVVDRNAINSHFKDKRKIGILLLSLRVDIKPRTGHDIHIITLALP